LGKIGGKIGEGITGFWLQRSRS